MTLKKKGLFRKGFIACIAESTFEPDTAFLFVSDAAVRPTQRPFRTACLLGCINRHFEGQARVERSSEHLNLFISVNAIYHGEVANYISEMTGASEAAETAPTDLARLVKGGMANESGDYSWVSARRLLGLDGSDESFVSILQSAPDISVEDFCEHHLGMSRFSINLSQAMVATVTAWMKSRW